MTSHTFHAIMSPIRASQPLGFPNTTLSDRFNRKFRFKMCLHKTSNIFHVMTSPIRALKPLGFPNTTLTNRFDSLVQQDI
ncbi:uncharacterized protein G2W53_033552 [Senna tora]|uniref:Uncharacterized protein n=1 Tax=Senna tora TaxID=362788 RepID=A0A834SZI9_9FABA|nr:uncharacterized protein G2W53_033552 [Senna tora]